MISIWQAVLWMVMWFINGVYIGYIVFGGGKK